MARIRPHVKVGSSHDPAVRRGALVSRAQRSTSRAFAPVFAGYGDALQTRDRYGASSWRSRISDASLADARAASRPGHTNSLGRARTLFTFQTAHLVPAAHFCARGLQLCFAHPNRGVGGAPRNVRVQRHPLGVPRCVKDARERAFAAARQALARRLASHDAGRSPLGAPPWRF
jgi:hypothetical protein